MQPSFCADAARCIDVARLELVRLYNEATEAQRSEQDGWQQIQLSLRELARECTHLRPDLIHRFSNDGPVLVTKKVHMDLPLDVGCVGYVEGAHDNGTPRGVLAPVAKRLGAIGAELAAMYAAASRAERPDVGEPIGISLRELQLQYPHAPLAEDIGSHPGPRSHADASVGTDDVEVEAPDGPLARRRMTVREVLAILDSGNDTITGIDNTMTGIASSMVVELAPCDGPHSFDVQNDVARMVCGRSAAALVVRLRWVGIVIGILGAALPILLVFAVHWARGGLGQFAMAYEWPLWLEVWMCVGWWLIMCVQLVCFASMQREIAWMALKQVATLWIIAMTGVFVAALVSLYEFGGARG